MPIKDLLEPGDVFKDYTIQEAYYHDGPIQLYLAADTRTNRQVKFQCIDSRPSENTPERSERFYAMLERLQALKHRHLGAVYDGGVTERIYWAATEHPTNGRTVGSILLYPAERFSLTSCLFLAFQLASALRMARRAGVMHLRLNPHRIVVQPGTGSLEKLLDIGMTELFSISPAFLRSDPLYVAPEQLREKGKAVDERADIYAFGMVLYALLDWAPPFADRRGKLPGRDRQLLNAMTKTPPPLREREPPLPEFLEVFVQSLIVKARSNRPSSWAVVFQQVGEIAGRHRVWGKALEDLGQMKPAERAALATALRGPMPEGAELEMMIARLLGKTLGTRDDKLRKPQSGKRPSAALRAAMDGYSTDEKEKKEQCGTPEPEWLMALPEEPEATTSQRPAELPAMAEPLALAELPAVAEPLALAEPPAVVEATVFAEPLALAELPAVVEPPLPIEVPVSAPQPTPEAGTPPPRAERHPLRAAERPSHSVVDPVPPVHQDAAQSLQDGAPPEPVTLPSGQLAAHEDPAVQRARPRRTGLAVAALFVAGFVALVGLRRPAAPGAVARSANLYAARDLCVARAAELGAAPALVEPRGPEPSAPQVTASALAMSKRATTLIQRALPLPTPSVSVSVSVSASASAEALTVGPTALTDQEKKELCEKFYCRHTTETTQEPGDSAPEQPRERGEQ